MSVMAKRILVNLPTKMYENLKYLAAQEYKSISGVIREALLEKLQDRLSKSQMNLIEKGRSEYRHGKGVSWRAVKRG